MAFRAVEMECFFASLQKVFSFLEKFLSQNFSFSSFGSVHLRCSGAYFAPLWNTPSFLVGRHFRWKKPGFIRIFSQNSRNFENFGKNSKVFKKFWKFSRKFKKFWKFSKNFFFLEVFFSVPQLYTQGVTKSREFRQKFSWKFPLTSLLSRSIIGCVLSRNETICSDRPIRLTGLPMS